MKNHLLKRILSLILVAAMLVGYYVPSASAAVTGLTWKESDQEIKLDLTERKAELHVEQPYAPTDIVRVSIVLEEKSTVQAGFATRNIANNSEAMAYSRSLRAKQDALAKTISAQALNGQKLDVAWNLTLVGNIISANVPYGKLEDIARVDGVADVFVENTYAPCVIDREEVANPQMYASLNMTGSSLVWSSGYTGAGSRVAIIDTGTDTDHQSLDAGAFLYALKQNAKAGGKSYDKYLSDLDLLDAKEIGTVLADLNIYEKDTSLTAAKLYLNEKLPFAVNYIDGADRRLVVDHETDGQGEHGSHVAGIAAANRYIPSGSGYAEAMQTVMMAGTAPDAQIITMKVFGSRGGPTDADYLAAVEDAILLGCDAVNLSLGSLMAGEGQNLYYADLLDYMTKTDTVVVASAGNSFSWPEASTYGYLYSSDVSLDTVGAPGSYYSFFSVASVENDGGVAPAFQIAGRNIAYSDGVNGDNNPLTTLDSSENRTGTEYEYVFIDGLGYQGDYEGMDLNGKIVFCSRGNINFSEKAEIAASLGAAATVIYNNEPGIFGMDLSYYYYPQPCVSIDQVDADIIREASREYTTSGGLTYYTGTMTVLGHDTGIMYNSEYLTMNDFSSWGVPGNLSIKPEITAPGGSIYSIYGETPYGGGADQYELMSGTSMAAPAVTGMAALLAQYLRESGLAKQEGMSVRALAQSLLMSTAVPLMEENSGGNYYSILKQGAGLARVDLAASADSYILVDGQSDGRVKAELGDDPNRTGVYEFSFTINNLTNQDQAYTLRADIFRQGAFESQEGSGIYLLDTWTTGLPGTASFTANGVSVAAPTDLSGYDLNGDGKTNGQDADYLLEYLLGNVTGLYGTGDVNADGKMNTYDAHMLLALLSSTGAVSVPAGGSVTVDVCLTLTGSAKALLDSTFENGTYVEAYVYAESVTTGEGVTGTSHSIPVLAFYGNWSDPNMFDYGTHVELMHNYDGKVPYLYNLIGSGNALTINYGDGQEYYFGGNPVVQDNAYLPARNAFNSQDDSYLLGQYFTLIRGFAGAQLVVSNADTGEVYMQRGVEAHTPAYYYVNGGYWTDIQWGVNVGWSGLDASGVPVPEGTNVEVSLVAAPEYYRNADGTIRYGELGEGAYLTTRMTIDNTAPQVIDATLDGTTLTVKAKDNQYVAAVMLFNSSGTSLIACDTPNQTSPKKEIRVDLDLADVFGKNFQVVVCDYAMNQSVIDVTLELDTDRPYFTVVDYPSSTYYGLDANGRSIALATGNRGEIQAAEFVDGYVFEITEGGYLHYASDEDLNSFHYLTQLDADNRYDITGFLDLAYNEADGKLYGLFYAMANYEATPYLCTIDMLTGAWEVLYELPVDVNNLAIDGNGNFYSTGFNSANLYTYTLKTLANGTMNYVGSMGYYYTGYMNSLAWDHNTDTLYWAYPNILLKIDHTTAQPTVVSYFDYNMTGLYIRPETWGNRFAPTNKVTNVDISHSEKRVIVGQTSALTAWVRPWTVTDGTVTWKSSNNAVATVDENGIVTGVSVGQATITATSTLDRTKKASCTVSVEELDTSLKALVWDEEGNVWWSSFNTDSLPSYTKLAAVTDNVPLAATAVANGTLYASTMDLATGLSDLYTVNPSNYQMTRVGGSEEVAYTDLAYAPSLGYLVATYSNYLLLVDPYTGEYMGAWDWAEGIAGDLVGITYYGSGYDSEYGTYLDYFLILDTWGDVYLEALMCYAGDYYTFYTPVDGFLANIGGAVDTSYFQSLYYDGSLAYWARYDESENVVELLAWDCDDSGDVYSMGKFPQGVWPVGGLYSDVELTSLGALAAKLERKEAASTAVMMELEPVSLSAPARGGLNAASDTAPESSVDLHSEGKFEKDTGKVTVTLTPGNPEGSTNGRMKVTFNTQELKLLSVTGATEAFAYTTGSGTVEVAFANTGKLGGEGAVAVLTFEVVKPGDHKITVRHTEDGNGSSNKEETLTVSSGCSHSYNAVVTKPTCKDKGYTTYTCSKCGHSYVDNYVNALGHSYNAVVTAPTCEDKGYTTHTCSRCGDSYVDSYVNALGHSYNAVVTAPTCEDKGYTTYTCSRCGDSYVSNYTDTVDHSYEDDSCIWCGQKRNYVKWISGTTSLNGTIDLNIYVALSDDILHNPNAYVRFIHSGVTVDVPVSEGLKSEKNGTVCYRYSCEIFAKQVADKVTVQVMTENGAVGKALNYSVMQYCVNQINKSTDKKLVAVCKTLLNYAAAAQTYFNYNTGNLANASLSDADKVLPDVNASNFKYSITGKEPGIRASSATLMLESEVKIRVYFQLTGDKSIEDYTFTIDGKVVEVKQNDKGYYIESEGIPAKELDDMHKFCVGGITVNYGALSYVNSKVSSSKTAENERNLAKALYAYYAAAEALLG